MSDNQAHTTAHSTPRALTNREKVILRAVIRNFIQKADPVGSRFLSKQNVLGLSAASIRNTMSDLEELGYLNHPYTSAGRIPTDLGYRMYVNELMEAIRLSSAEKKMFLDELNTTGSDTNFLLRETTKLLGRLTNLLAIALTPNLSKGVLQRLEVVPLSTTQAMFIVSIQGELVKTIVLRIAYELERNALEQVVQLLNERLAGLTLEEIRNTCEARMKDISERDTTGVIQLMLRQTDVIFSDAPEEQRLQIGGTQGIMVQPEFRSPEQVEKIFTLLENEEVIVHLLENKTKQSSVAASVSIGSENVNAFIESCSVVTAPYKFGDTIGIIGLIGPTRMHYARAIALVEHVSKTISH